MPYNPGMKLECPKCASPNARLTKSTHDLELVCYCGYRKLVYTTLKDTEDGPLMENNDSGPAVKLPREGTNFRRTLMVLSVMPEASSAEITERLNDLNGKESGQEGFLTVSDVSSYLTILRSKGLVDRVEIRRGVSGGSTWTLTDAAEDLMGF